MELRVKFSGNSNVDDYEQVLPVTVISGDLRVQVDGPPGEGESGTVTFDVLCRDYRHILLSGTVKDSTGQTVHVHQEIPELGRYEERDGSRYRLHYDAIRQELSGIRSELQALREPNGTEPPPHSTESATGDGH